jgi:hypothetical protein
MSFFSQTKYLKVETSFYEPNYGNYKFDTDLTYFGIMKERKIRKVNKLGSILKLKEVKDINSIYPMIDEFGYTFCDFFIFRSTWDFKYHLETSIASKKVSKRQIDDFLVEKSLMDFELQNITIGKPSETNNLNTD